MSKRRTSALNFGASRDVWQYGNLPSSGTAELPLLLSILEELPIGVWVARAPGGEFVYANRAFGGILGMGARDDVRVGGYAPVYHIEDRAGRPFPEDRLPFVQALRRHETALAILGVLEFRR